MLKKILIIVLMLAVVGSAFYFFYWKPMKEEEKKEDVKPLGVGSMQITTPYGIVEEFSGTIQATAPISRG